MNKKKKYDTLAVGIISGIILPVITFVILWLVTADISLGAYLKSFYKMESLAGLLSLCTIPNLLLFFVYIWTNRNRSARGVIIATFVLAAVMLIFKVL